MRYRWPFVLSVLAAAPLGVRGTTPLKTLWNDIRTKHKWNATPTNWESLGRPPAGTTIDLHIALRAHHENALIDAVYEVSTPGLPKYGAYLSKEQVAEIVAPHPDTLELVNSWLKHYGISSSSVSRTHGGGWLTVTNVPVSKANDLLGASYQLYRHTGTDGTAVIIRTVGYALPAALHAHVLTVAPTTHFGPYVLQQTPSKRSGRGSAAMETATSGELVTGLSRRLNLDDLIDPSFLRSLYKTPTYVPAATDRNKLGIVGYSGSYPSKVDLMAFVNQLRDDANAATFTVERVNGGGNDPSRPGTEANGNIQYSTAMAYPTPLIFYSIGGVMQVWPNNEPAPGDAHLEWLAYILDEQKIPQTISISYGNSELDIPREYAAALCFLFAHLAARGVSVLAASGDAGVGHGDCKDRSGKVQFNILFPASCPWVTSVGGTTRHDPEVAASISQGGFSIFFAREPYQDDAVNGFLEQLDSKYSGFYNPAARGGPDIAAQALNYQIFNNGKPYAMNGTSCATPIVAGIISLLNDYLLSKDKQPLGFLNPWLYGPGLGGFNDITSGSNPGCNTAGFAAIAGWDPVTGLGTPDFEKLLQILYQTRIMVTPDPSDTPNPSSTLD
ncbi:subtilisin-like protein [Lactarius psammicola]|nr:subtilisin-like protein [Lactarius psammicola]